MKHSCVRRETGGKNYENGAFERRHVEAEITFVKLLVYTNGQL